MGLVENFAGYVDQTVNLEQFFDLIWNVDTAQGYGLDVWGRIVGVARTLQVAVGSYWGFAEAGDAETFNNGQFYSGAPLTSNYTLSDNAYRTLIFAKALANISDNSMPSLNQMLLNLFPHRGNCYVTEGNRGDNPYFGFAESTTAWGFNQAPFYSGQSLPRMIMTYTFDFTLSPVELAIVAQSGVLPKPTGVKSSVVQNP
ncbi:MAG: DUF2612 domain-containing protein [Patescibacteria group bacterium]|nr:DUF2612 domain-containing protein [Patescibacteria group bacterium]